MRTRRSPHNQDRLFKELFKAKDESALPAKPPLTDTEIDAMSWIGPTSRNLMKRDAAKARRMRSRE